MESADRQNATTSYIRMYHMDGQIVKNCILYANKFLRSSVRMKNPRYSELFIAEFVKIWYHEIQEYPRFARSGTRK